MRTRTTCHCLTIGGLAAIFALGSCATATAQTTDPALNALVKKGILTEQEAKDALADTKRQLAECETNAPAPSRWKINKAIKDIELFGDVRLRYEYRAAENATLATLDPDHTYQRERFRYAVRVGVRGGLFDDFYYGLRLETSQNPRSPWNTFGDDTNPTPSAKNSDGVNIGQVYLGWRPFDWYEVTVGRMPMPLYTTPMLWDSDINPEGAAEKFKISLGHYLDLFANFGQFIYQDTNPDASQLTTDTFILAWQLGANVNLAKDVSLKVAPVIYTYTGFGTTNAFLSFAYNGQGGAQGGNNFSDPSKPYFANQTGLNDLLIVEIPAELNFKVASVNARVFGDFARNLYGERRARHAFAASAGSANPLPHPITGQDTAYQLGLGVGNLGLVYGTTSKKNTWEARAYWQHTEQYAVDVNLIDSDFFEGRANLEGVYSALAYSFTDSIIGTFRYGYAHPINHTLGTGGNNPDLAGLNPIRNYHLIQLDLTWRF